MTQPIKSVGDRFRHTSDLSSRWFGKGRRRMIEVCKDLGITDICTCNPDTTTQGPWQVRPDSGKVGMNECSTCHHLLWPLSYVYDCDECTEPVLADKFPVPLDEDFLCIDCILEQ
jgi:hypothetical protein